jgi:FMN phosphatase YigB (HAD superfamily)
VLVVDFDGTLVDNLAEGQFVCDLLERATRKEVFRDPLPTLVYDPDFQPFQEQVPHEVRDELFRIAQSYFLSLYKEEEKLMAQLRRNLGLLNRLGREGWEIYVVSYCSEGYVKELLEGTNDDVGWLRFRCGVLDKTKVLEELKGHARKIVYVDDQIGDLLDARKLGIELVWVCYSGKLYEPKGIEVVEDFLELEGLLSSSR